MTDSNVAVSGSESQPQQQSQQKAPVNVNANTGIGKPLSFKDSMTDDENQETEVKVDAGTKQPTPKPRGQKQSKGNELDAAIEEHKKSMQGSGEPGQDKNNLVDFFKNIENEEFGEPEQQAQAEDDIELPEDVTPGSRAEQRIRKLVEERKSVQAEAEKANNIAWQYYQHSQDMERNYQQHLSKMQAQYAATQAKMEMLLNQQNMSRRQAEEDDPVAMAEREWTKKVEDMVTKRVAPIKQEYDNFRKEAAKRQEAAMLRNASREADSEAQAALAGVVLKGLPEDVAGGIGGLAKDFTYAVALRHNISIQEAAKVVRRFGIKYGMGLAQGLNSQSKQQINTSAKAPKVAPQGNISSNEADEPSPELLLHNGFRGVRQYYDWERAGRPALKPIQ